MGWLLVACLGHMERNEISRQEVEVFRALIIQSGIWQTNAEIANACSGVAPRTVRAMTLKFVKLGIVDQAEVFPAHRFRLSIKADKRNRGYVDRLRRTAEVFGIALSAPARDFTFDKKKWGSHE